MLRIYIAHGGRLHGPTTTADAANAVWFDLESPEPFELAFVTRETGLALPSKTDLSEIEASSRLSQEGDTLTLSLPTISRQDNLLNAAVSGFVLSPTHLVTLRFASSPLFEHFPESPHPLTENAPAQLFAGLMEAIVGRQADALEALRGELDSLSHRIFHQKLGLNGTPPARKLRNTERELQAILITLGRGYDTISVLRDSQLGVARIIPYTQANAPWLPKSASTRLTSAAQDVASLNEFSTHLTDKVQFLLDATLGLINISQNTLIKVLTIVSIVGIPPTLIAGIYGMNFHIPELSWTYGYAYAWVVMTLSAVLPLAWFRKKGWI
jgi:magnesium transporter